MDGDVHAARAHEPPPRAAADAEGIADRVGSISFIATLPPAERAEVESRARSLVPANGVVALPYRTDVWIARRR